MSLRLKVVFVEVLILVAAFGALLAAFQSMEVR